MYNNCTIVHCVGRVSVFAVQFAVHIATVEDDDVVEGVSGGNQRWKMMTSLRACPAAIKGGR